MTPASATSASPANGNNAGKDATGAVPGPLPRRPWWHRTCPPEDRRRIMTDLAIRPVEHWVHRFATMLTLSVVVATMGLELNSAAIVIGAMLLAPLMQPVLATGATLSMALFTKALWSFTKVVLATVWCIALAWFMAKQLPDRELTTEIVSRTRPDIRDLVVALAAGAAGAYATVREDASASLPGVAVAVALVPPLATAGITLEAGDMDRATGALLLYTTNLMAIILISIMVFVVTGFVPPRRLARTLPRLALASVVIASVVLVVAVPLYSASVAAIEATEDLNQAEAVVDEWLGENSGLQKTVRFDNGLLSVELRGFEAPVDQEIVEAELARQFPDLDRPPFVYWIRTQRATTTSTSAPTPDEVLLSEVGREVRAWLDESGIDHRIDRVAILDGVVRIEASGTDNPPSVQDLGGRIAELSEGLTPRLYWSDQEAIGPDDEQVSPLELVTETVEAEVERWAADRSLVVRSIDYDGDRLEIEVAGPIAPSGLSMRQLEQRVADIDPDGFELDVFYVQRLAVTTTTSTTAPTTSITSTTSATSTTEPATTTSVSDTSSQPATTGG